MYGPSGLRVTGSKVSPGLYESIELLGRERTLERIRAAPSWRPERGDASADRTGARGWRRSEHRLDAFLQDRSEEARGVRVGEKETSEQAAIVARYADLFTREQLEGASRGRSRCVG